MGVGGKVWCGGKVGFEFWIL